MFDVKAMIRASQIKNKPFVKFQVLGRSEKVDITDQLDQLHYNYDVYTLREPGMEQTPYDIIVKI